MKRHTKMFLFTPLDMWPSKIWNVKINSVNPVIFNKVNGCFEETDGNKYLTLVPTNESNEKMKKYEELWSNYDEKYENQI